MRLKTSVMALSRSIMILPMLAILFAGCLGFGGASCAVGIPEPTAGDYYRYTAMGLPKFLGIEPILDAEKSAGQQMIGILGDGSLLNIQLAHEPENRLTIEGSTESALRASYTLTPPGQTPLAFADEWISLKDGQPVQTALRTVLAEDDSTLHFTRFSRVNRPPLLLSALFWGSTLELGERGTVAVPEELGFTGINRQDAPGEIHWEVMAVDGSRCTAIVEATIASRPDFEGLVQIEMQNGRALPIRYDVQATRPAFSLALELLEGPTSPLGIPLAPFAARDLGESILPTVEYPDGCPPGTGVFPSDCLDARNRARSDVTVSQWLEDHEDAIVSKLLHRAGAGNSGIIDQWEFSWKSGGDVLTAIVDQRSRLVPLPGLENEYVVTARAGSGDSDLPVLTAMGPPMKYLTELHQKMYSGTSPEVLQCNFQIGFCGLGTHRGTGMAYAGETSGGAIWTGLAVDIPTGLILQENSYDESALGRA